MFLSIRKIIFNKPWLLPVLFFLAFVALWMSFIFFAVKHKPQEVERAAPLTSQVTTSLFGGRDAPPTA